MTTRTRYASRLVFWNGASQPFSSGEVTTHFVSKPVTTYRSRPTDLWAGGTNRDVVSVKYTTEPARWQHYSYGPQDWVVDDLACRILDMSGIYDRSSFDNSHLYNRVRSQIRGDAINLANCLGEYRSTAAMFPSWATRFYNLTRAVVKKDPRILWPQNRWSPTKATANLFLEYQYGLKPLLSDIDGAMKALAERAISRPIYISGVVRSSVSARDERVKSPACGGLYWSGSKAYYTEDAKAEYKTAYRAKLSSSYISSTLANYGMLNPLSLAYELTPLSFVADWIINVGDILSSLDNLVIFDELLVRDSATQTVTVSVVADSKGINASCSRTRVFVSRKAPRPISVIITPALKPNPITTSHIATACALIRQAVRK